MNNKGFVDPGNLLVGPDNSLVVTDRGANMVYRLNSDGSRDAIAGNGSTNNVIDVTVHLLRESVDQGFPMSMIQTVRGVGYRLGIESASPNLAT